MADETLQAEAIIGFDAERLINSELGQVMIGICKQKEQEATEALLVSDPNDAAKGAFLRSEIRRYREFPGLLRYLYVQGKNAVAELDVRQAEAPEDA